MNYCNFYTNDFNLKISFAHSDGGAEIKNNTGLICRCTHQWYVDESEIGFLLKSFANNLKKNF